MEPADRRREHLRLGDSRVRAGGAAIEPADQRRSTVVAVPVPPAREQMLADGRPPALVRALLASAKPRPVSDLVTSAMEQITGTAARTFRQWATEHADDCR